MVASSSQPVHDEKQTLRPICVAFKQGRCQFGDSCFFRHELDDDTTKAKSDSFQTTLLICCAPFASSGTKKKQNKISPTTDGGAAANYSTAAADELLHYFDETLDTIHENKNWFFDDDIDSENVTPRVVSQEELKQQPTSYRNKQQQTATRYYAPKSAAGGVLGSNTYEAQFAARAKQKERMKQRILEKESQKNTGHVSNAEAQQKPPGSVRSRDTTPRTNSKVTPRSDSKTAGADSTPQTDPAAGEKEKEKQQQESQQMLKELVYDENAKAYYHTPTGYYYDFEGEPFVFDDFGYRCFWDEEMKPYYIDENNDAWYYDDHEEYQEYYQTVRNYELLEEKQKEEEKIAEEKRREKERLEQEFLEKERKRRPKFKTKKQIEEEMSMERQRKLEERKEREKNQQKFPYNYNSSSFDAAGDDQSYGDANTNTSSQKNDQKAGTRTGSYRNGGRSTSNQHQQPRSATAGNGNKNPGNKAMTTQSDVNDAQVKINQAIQKLMREMKQIKNPKEKKVYFKKCLLRFHPDKNAEEEKFVVISYVKSYTTHTVASANTSARVVSVLLLCHAWSPPSLHLCI
ncbi:unnamed protein product [Amoebophrya sp. A120]|nr:unnamed protein product [Amoebophrya sp. A120]|eukprot:GSA120T00019809001.1